jgi:hypothetical protein
MMTHSVPLNKPFLPSQQRPHVFYGQQSLVPDCYEKPWKLTYLEFRQRPVILYRGVNIPLHQPVNEQDIGHWWTTDPNVARIHTDHRTPINRCAVYRTVVQENRFTNSRAITNCTTNSPMHHQYFEKSPDRFERMQPEDWRLLGPTVHGWCFDKKTFEFCYRSDQSDKAYVSAIERGLAIGEGICKRVLDSYMDIKHRWLGIPEGQYFLPGLFLPPED